MTSVAEQPPVPHDFGNDPVARGFLDGAALQAVLTSHVAKFNQIIAVLDYALRDDNELRNGSVRAVTLHSELVALIASAAGWQPKKAAAWTTTGNLTLAGLSVQAGGEWTATLAAGTRILVQDQLVQAENGLWIADAGPWVRATDADTAEELGLAFVAVEAGATRGATTWVVTSAADEIVLDTSSIVWAAVGGTGTGGGGGGGSELPVPNDDDLLGWVDGELVNVPRSQVAAGDLLADWVSDPFTGDGSVPSFVLRRPPGSIDNMDVTIDGVTMRPVEHYLLSGQTVTFLTPPTLGAKILVRYGAMVAQGSTSYSQETRDATAGQTEIILTSSYVPGANTLSLYVNGLRLLPGIDFTETDANTVTMLEPLELGDVIHLVYGQQYNADVIGTAQLATAAVTTPKIADAAVTLPKLSADLQLQLGSAVTPTGVIAMRASKTVPASWLGMDGRTIGSAFSGATSRANADTQALFELLWTDHANADLPIQDSLGAATTRGASAAADFAANKRLPIPDMRGEFARGWDDGRGVDAGRVFGALQLDALKSHNHTVVAVLESGGWTNIGDSGSAGAYNQNLNTSSTGGAETRPRNRAYTWIIKL